MAPSCRGWIIDVARERELRQLAAGRQVETTVDDVLSWAEFSERLEPDPRSAFIATGRPTDRGSGVEPIAAPRTQSASSFASHVAEQPPDATIRQVERLAETAAGFGEMARGLAQTRAQAGERPVREALVALLHARARSHSWRMTRWLGPVEVTMPLADDLGRQIDQSRTGDQVAAAVARVQAEWPELDYTLAAILYARSHSRRWQATRMFRRAFAMRWLRPVRTVLRTVRCRLPRLA
jgi:hypothetical protein